MKDGKREKHEVQVHISKPYFFGFDIGLPDDLDTFEGKIVSGTLPDNRGEYIGYSFTASFYVNPDEEE